MRRARCIGFVAIVALLCLLACEDKKPKKAGDVCKIEDEGKWFCADATNAFFCKASRLIAIPCRGPRGCSGKRAADATCDTSLARVGDGCHAQSDDVSWNTRATCSEDKKSRLVCIDGKIVLEMPCKGRKGCDPDASRAPLWSSCDRRIVDEGDACNVHGTRESPWGACSADGKKLLECSLEYEKGTFVVTRMCTGPQGCTTENIANLFCDRSVASEGAPCGSKDDVHDACTPDERAIVQCRAGKYGLKETCPPKKKCGKAYSSALDPSCIPL